MISTGPFGPVFLRLPESCFRQNRPLRSSPSGCAARSDRIDRFAPQFLNAWDVISWHFSVSRLLLDFFIVLSEFSCCIFVMIPGEIARAAP